MKTLVFVIGFLCIINVSQTASLFGCAHTPCFNDGACYQLNNGRHVCVCKEGWSGEDCSVDVDECITSPCHFNGLCTNTPGGFECICQSGFFGERCELRVPQKNKRLILSGFPTPPPPETTTEFTTQSPPPFTTDAPPTPHDIKTPPPITTHTVMSHGTTLAPPEITVG